jgi:hypothetical protein
VKRAFADPMPLAWIIRHFTFFPFLELRADLFGCEMHPHLSVLFLGELFKIIK